MNRATSAVVTVFLVFAIPFIIGYVSGQTNERHDHPRIVTACWVEREQADETGFYCGDKVLAPTDNRVFVRWATAAEAARSAGR